jgi:thiamine pyrophosphate-dependent acetolactate synthase large subunit-like protein
MQQRESMRILRQHVTDDDVVILGIGSPNIDWLALGQRELNFSIFAAMGLAQSFGLGMALAQPDRRVLVMEGDGGVLMSLGAIASAAEQAPPNLKHFVFTNRSFGATGNQPLPSATRLDFAAAAHALGAAGCHFTRVDDLEREAERLIREPGYAVVSIETDQGILRDFPPELRPAMPIHQRARFLRAMGLER